MLGFSKKYKSSKIETDLLTDFFANKNRKEHTPNKAVQNNMKNNPLESIKKNKYDEPRINLEIPIEIKYFSTTALSKEIDISSKELFRKFEQLILLFASFVPILLCILDTYFTSF